MSPPTPTAAVWDAVHLNLATPADVEAQLEAAVNALMPTAAARNCGILVRQHGPGRYVAQVSSEVPCGLTREQSVWVRTPDPAITPDKVAREPANGAGVHSAYQLAALKSDPGAASPGRVQPAGLLGAGS